MADFFAAVASNLLFLGNLLTLIIFFVLFFFRLVLGVLATCLFKTCFAATPPDLATILTAMNAATPVKVFRLEKILATVFAYLFCNVKLASFHFEPLYAILHFIPLHH